MLNDVTPKNRQLTNFVKPYEIFSTPYYKLDFSEITKIFCESRNCKADSTSSLRVCKVIIVGDVSVGKTSIVNRFCRKMFDTSYKATIGVDFEMERFSILGIPYNLQIWDTAGQERFRSIAQSYYRNSHVVVIVFDLSKPDTLLNTRKWFFDAMNTCGDMLPYVFVVGTKKDLLGGFAYKTAELNAVNVAKSLNAEYWPVSSKNGENIDLLFARIAALTFDDCIKNEKARSIPITISNDIVSTVILDLSSQIICVSVHILLALNVILSLGLRQLQRAMIIRKTETFTQFVGFQFQGGTTFSPN